MSASRWRDVMAWSVAAAIVYGLAMWGAATLLHQDILRVIVPPTSVTAQLGLCLTVSIAVAGFTNRKRPLNLRNLCGFLIQNAVAIVALLLAISGFGALARTGAASLSEWVAAMIGATLLVLAIFGGLAMASTHTGFALVDDEVAAEDMRERGRMFLYSFAWTAACGVLLIVLSLAGPVGVLSPEAALMGALVVLALLIGLGVATWRLSDELTRALSQETGNMAFYLILGLGGGWATLAHLGFLAAPAPLDWLTLFIVLTFAASFIVLGRRKLLTV